MNKERRKRIEEASAKIAEAEAALQAAQEIIQEVRDGEESARENLPESLQDGERGQAAHFGDRDRPFRLIVTG